ncbi:MAG: hypothetical protein NT113_19795, partial [Hyphomicrobiales bacterium]|nr:hypothetical protein [Hyphomicrobiales bacterium]
ESERLSRNIARYQSFPLSTLVLVRAQRGGYQRSRIRPRLPLLHGNAYLLERYGGVFDVKTS